MGRQPGIRQHERAGSWPDFRTRHSVGQSPKRFSRKAPGAGRSLAPSSPASSGSSGPAVASPDAEHSVHAPSHEPQSRPPGRIPDRGWFRAPRRTVCENTHRLGPGQRFSTGKTGEMAVARRAAAQDRNKTRHAWVEDVTIPSWRRQK